MRHSRRTASMAAALIALLAPAAGRTAPLDLTPLSCATYENDVLAAKLPGYEADPIDTVMWLFGYSVAKAGERVMYGDSLTAFGFALDGVCKNNPATPLLEAILKVKSKRDNPMDLTRLTCATFISRHTELRKSDPESATTLTMWLFGYSSGLVGSRVLDAGAVRQFDSRLSEWCEAHPGDSVFDALSAPNPAVVAPPRKPAKTGRGLPKP